LTRAPIQESEGKGHWVADVWRLGERNLNGRTYTKEVATKVIKETPSTLAYDGHYADVVSGNEYGIAKAICKNPRIEGELLKVDIEFIDKEFEEKLEKISKAGVPIGVSSVGYGEVDAKGVIISATYSLVRYLDFVTSPAGEVYATHTNEEAKNSQSVDNEDKKEVSESYQKLAKKITNFKLRRTK
jgi:hypothetical protein